MGGHTKYRASNLTLRSVELTLVEMELGVELELDNFQLMNNKSDLFFIRKIINEVTNGHHLIMDHLDDYIKV